MKVNSAKDFVERVGWTFLQILIGSLAAYLETGDAWSWATMVNIVVAAAIKVLIAQQVGTRGSGDAIPGGVIESDG